MPADGRWDLTRRLKGWNIFYIGWKVVEWLVCFQMRYVFGLCQLTYLITPWCRVLLEKLTGLQLVKKFPAFHGTRRFIAALTGVRHLSLSWASPIQSIYPHPTSWRSILILSTHLHLGLPSGLFPSGFPTYQHSSQDLDFIRIRQKYAWQLTISFSVRIL